MKICMKLSGKYVLCIMILNTGQNKELCKHLKEQRQRSFIIKVEL